jgi:YegS/Rv2252/BmrU family lipid kinase
MKPSDGYITYIINPKSGADGRKTARSQFQDYLRDEGYRVRANVTASLEHACELATRAAADPECILVVAAGGDGTIREIAHGLEGSDKVLLIVPSGTENLLANELGFDRRLETLVRTFESGVVRPLDLGMANGKCFTSIAGFGFDGAVVDLVNQRRTGHISHLDYVQPLWRTFWSHRFEPLKVAVDGQEIFHGPAMVFVGNISRYALGLQILHYADFGDGLLDVCIYKCRGRLHLIKHSLMTILKRHADRPDVIYRQGRHVVVGSEVEGIKTQIDGDPGPSLPTEIRIVPSAVRCMVPAGAKPAGIRRRILRSFR